MNKRRRRKARARRKWGKLSADAQIARRHLVEGRRLAIPELVQEIINKGLLEPSLSDALFPNLTLDTATGEALDRLAKTSFRIQRKQAASSAYRQTITSEESDAELRARIQKYIKYK